MEKMRSSSVSTPPIKWQRKITATVVDDEGGEHEVVVYAQKGELIFEAVENEAKERGIRFATIWVFQIENNTEEGKDE